MVGVLVMLAWGGMEVVKGRAAAVAAGVAVVLCMVAASRQAAFWQNSGTLFEHAIDVTRNNYVAESGLGGYLAMTGRKNEAIPHFEEAVRLVPDDSRLHNNLGILYGGMPGHEQQAIAHFEAAVRNHPDYMEAQYNLGLALSQVPGRTVEAIGHLEAAERIAPNPAIVQMIERLKSGGR